MQTSQLAILFAALAASVAAFPRAGFPCYFPVAPAAGEQTETADGSPSYAPYKGFNNFHPSSNYHPSLSKPYYYNAYDRQSAAYEDTDASSDNQNANENAMATDNLAGAKSENANENANLAKGGEAFGFGALESDNRNLLANENNIEVANANKNELGVEVANFNANENSAEQESAALAEVMNEDNAEFTDYQENTTDNLNLNDNKNEKARKAGCTV
ncbi:hypothetical protein FPQ18DRAFT_402882 [Pyronema domesticum]|uniref:Uncharacterized protein n=1 Tax=Pyronema omphalodes (strain CBS 100304) TaxID=1076935 RepID=U4LUC6_PYROM|nr:hypothetical protein FPQ18DRAFT_402882 [Pyronema domesticum]CCX31541.1 Protein of unknown function [Pyronema omphalodes CBS 100304]